MLSSGRDRSLQKFTDAKMWNYSFEMQSRHLLQVLFALSSLFLSKAQDVIGSGPSCLTSSTAGDGLTRVTFLREDAAGVLSLFLTLWSGDPRLVTCEVHADPLVTERYRALCDRSDTQGQEISQRFNISSLLAPGAPCALLSSSAPKFTRRTRGDGAQGKARRKRSWLFPGTLWCGTGSRAGGYEHLGMFESTDRCCREHDHCLHIIPSFTKNYGVFNSRFYTVSHCDCDQRFRQCLLGVNDSISTMVGYSFFSMLQVPCFQLKQQRPCTEKKSRVRCRAAKQAPIAILKSPLPYNATEVISQHGDNTDSNKVTFTDEQHVTKSPKINSDTNSTKSEHRCSSKDRFRGDTFYLRGKKGKGCKRHRKLNLVAPSQIPSISQAYNTTSAMETSLLHASKSSTLMSDTKRAGKKNSTRKGLSTYTTQRSHAPQRETTISYPQKTSTTQKPALQLHLSTAITAVTKTTKSHKEVTPRGYPFQHRCKSCVEQKITPHTTTVTPSATTYDSLIEVTTSETPWLKKTTETPTQDTWSTATSARTITAKLTTAASFHKDGKRQKQMDSHPLGNNATQGPMSRTQAPKHAVRGLKLNLLLHNMTDNQLLCRSLKHLDECKYKIPPLEKKYHLENMESKTAFHCDCTSRLAVQIESYNQPSVLPKLLIDFVSQYCFKLPKEKKCDIRKSCSGGFTKASDLLQALKKIEKDTAGVRNSSDDRKRGIPVRFYKRCLRLQRKADVMAQLT